MAAKKQGDAIEQAQEDVAQAEQHLEAAQVEVVEARQERAQAEQQQRQAGEGAVIEEQIAALRMAAESDAPRVGYSVGVWAGRPHYRANDGSFDTFDEDEMRAHVRRQIV